ncbi:acyl-CoA dehydrogenase family protein [Corynebacterium neomassiliense]|uniref:acyl-CoA dehydrogenase family protein n=1 Tax=Corynebacterium neomassiliense TaxID=2079482 RepID=UPI001031D5DF|nr:acyl-CoA dehydrogenase family protein [Corynebacterium neomassiliense]
MPPPDTTGLTRRTRGAPGDSPRRLSPPDDTEQPSGSGTAAGTASRATSEVTAELRAVLDGPFAAARDSARALTEQKHFRPDATLTLDEARERTFAQLHDILGTGAPRGAFRTAHGGTGDIGTTLAAIETVGGADLSLMVKAGVQWGLWGGAVENLGTERHIPLIRDIMELRVPGSFAMTERGHGSDVQALQTTAVYDRVTREFVINTPTPMAEKWYIGNAARHATKAAVFCQLYTPAGDYEPEDATDPTVVTGGVPASWGPSHGVHCIIVGLRDHDGGVLPGVHIGDHGHKGGLPGVDNGTIRFDHVRVPAENLLNRFADVSPDGTYSSPVESDGARFFTMLGALVRGRITVGASAGAAARTALTIATGYANRRRQFAPHDSLPETRLIGHRQHRLRLIPLIARSYALQTATNQLITRLAELESTVPDRTAMTDDQAVDQRELEAHAAALKAVNTSHATRTIQECREACGGAGYMAENLLTSFKADSDVFTTFEGDNVVMLQLAAKELLTGFSREMSGLGPLDLVRFGLDSFGTLLKRRTAAGTVIQNLVDSVSDRETTSLFDPAYQIELLTEREDRLLMSLIRRIRPARKMDVADAAALVDSTQDHMVACALAHVDRIVLESLLEAESGMEEGQAKRIMEQVRDVYVLDIIHSAGSWYQEQNILTGTRTKAARAALNDLVDSLGPWSQVLVDAFAVPATVLDIPLLQDVDDPSTLTYRSDTCPAAGMPPAGEPETTP